MSEFPKWVPVHESQIVRKSVPGAPDHVAVPAWPDFHVDRVSGAVTVLVNDAEAEAKAIAEPVVAAVESALGEPSA